MDKANFIELGLNKSEIEIYLTLLRKGRSTTTQLAKETGIHRTYIYDIIEKLREKALISQIKEQRKQFVQANNPEKIKENLLYKISVAEKLIPELEKIKSKSKEETTVEVYKGREGIKSILNDIIKEKQDYLAFGTISFFEDEKILPKTFIENWITRVNEAKLKEKVVVEKGMKITPSKRSKCKFLPKEYLFFSSVIVYGDKVALFIWKEPFLQILIKNKDIAKTYLTQFNILWKLAKK